MLKIDPSKNLKLDKEEQEIEEALVKGEWVSVADLAKQKKFFKQAAQNFQELRRSKRVSIRINRGDLLKVKIKAQRNGIPYQTLLNSLIHRYAEGQTRVEL